LLKKFGFVLMSLTLLVAFVTPSFAHAEESEIPVSKTDLENTETLVNVIEELDQNLDMENLSANSPEDINRLSVTAKDLYNSILEYANTTSEPLTGEDMALILSTQFHKLSDNQSTETSFSTMGVVNNKKWKLSNSKIKQLNRMAGWNAGFWATATAVARIWAKSPTALTGFLIAIPLVGMAAINSCNKREKGVYIRQVGSGATNNYFCEGIR
jgi:hypothetical protein